MKVTTLALNCIAFQRHVLFQANPIPFPIRKENFTINQEYPARSVYFEIVMIIMMMVIMVVVVVVVTMSQAFTFWIAAG